MNDHTSVEISSTCYCDLCNLSGKGKVEAQYDGATAPTGQWAYMCELHFNQYGTGLGLGIGQRLILKTREEA